MVMDLSQLSEGHGKWGGMLRSGKAFRAFGTVYDYEPLEKAYGPSRHMTFVFNVFVFL